MFFLHIKNQMVTTQKSISYKTNLETFSLIWLDAEVNNDEGNKQTQAKLRQIINHLDVFNDQFQCEQYICSISAEDRIVLIVSGRLGREIVPRIHSLRQISSIYVYCQDRKANEKWAQHFPKVKHIIVDLDVLINKIRSYQNVRGCNRIEEPCPLKIHTNGIGRTTLELNGQFAYTLLLIDGLIRLKSQANDRDVLVSFCKNEYKKNAVELKIIEEFAKNYKEQNALWWYTRESFLYRMLNKALRVHNVHVLYLFRFVIRDIYQRLKENQCQTPITVYRGQLMSPEEVRALQQSTGSVISMTSFFSTTTDMEQVMPFLINPDADQSLCRVLFTVRADPSKVKSLPFAIIKQFSFAPHESEVLFMAGCVFRLNRILFRQTDKVHVIEMELLDECEHDEYKLYEHLRTEYGCNCGDEISRYSYGNILVYMGQYELAEKILYDLITSNNSNDFLPYDLYHSLAILHKEKKEFPKSLEWFERSLTLQLKNYPPNFGSIGDLYCCIGNIHKEMDAYDRALQCYDRAVDSYRKALMLDQTRMAAIYHGQAAVFTKQKKYEQAINFYQKSVDILVSKNLATNDKGIMLNYGRDIALNHDGMGTVYRHLGRFQEALQHYNEALKMRKKSLPQNHPDIAKSYKNIAFLHSKRKDWTQSLNFYTQAETVLHRTFSPDHPDIVKIRKDIQSVKFQTK